MNHNWRKSPARHYLKCVAVALHDKGCRGKVLIAEVNKLVPDWKKEFESDGPIGDNAIVQRADKGRRYETERPENNAVTSQYWKRAVRDVKNGKSTFDFGTAKRQRRQRPKPSRVVPISRAASVRKRRKA